MVTSIHIYLVENFYLLTKRKKYFKKKSIYHSSSGGRRDQPRHPDAPRASCFWMHPELAAPWRCLLKQKQGARWGCLLSRPRAGAAPCRLVLAFCSDFRQVERDRAVLLQNPALVCQHPRRAGRTGCACDCDHQVVDEEGKRRACCIERMEISPPEKEKTFSG